VTTAREEKGENEGRVEFFSTIMERVEASFSIARSRGGVLSERGWDSKIPPPFL
jgi:hypothetical protein